MKTTTYGQKDGEGPTLGKRANVYEIDIPDGSKIKKRTFGDYGDTALATALRLKNGKIFAAVWADRPGWEGDFGYLTAKRIR